MNPADMYVKGIKQKLVLYYAAWLPNVEIRLGDVGILKDNFFERVCGLKDLGISFQELPDDNPSTLDITSDKEVSINFKAAGKADSNFPNVPEGQAGVSIAFGSAGAFVIKANDVYQPQIANIAKLQDEVLAAYKNGTWKPDWAVVVKLMRTSNAMIFVSRSSNSKVEMSASGQVPAGSFKLVDPSINLQVVSTSGDLVKVQQAEKVTPLFQLARIHQRFLSGPDVRLAKAPPKPELYLDLVP